jgi:hypothetical protein
MAAGTIAGYIDAEIGPICDFLRPFGTKIGFLAKGHSRLSFGLSRETEAVPAMRP